MRASCFSCLYKGPVIIICLFNPFCFMSFCISGKNPSSGPIIANFILSFLFVLINSSNASISRSNPFILCNQRRNQSEMF